MKKIVALALSLVMALALCTTAFAAVPLWTQANANTKFDAYDYDNQIVAEDLTIEYVAAKAPTYDKDGFCTAEGNIAFYWIKDADAVAYGHTGYVVVDKWVEGCVALKMANAKVEAANSQTSPEAVYYMMPITAAYYSYTGVKFDKWGKTCGEYKDPANDNTYVQFKMDKEYVQAVAKDAVDGHNHMNVLVDGKVYTFIPGAVATKYEHNWVAEKLDTKTGKVETYKCSICGTVGTVVESSFCDAAKGKTLVKLVGTADRFGHEDTLIAFSYTAGTTNTTTSPKTFDAGIAMYVGMSLMSVAGSAVVIGKKKEF